ncbi:unnamed protein product [Paramecium primaurelia]|uniref:Tetratricopeptide repeat protein n=1 Tax=Paramecium primaurelia TaxID=5886 RepID=A0A8S1NDQ1_PARPR|nr:unnamed protein product [Paramecium primaurelia]
MIQQQNLKLICSQDGHQDDIDMICYNQYCKEFRLNCFQCIKKGIHHAHLGDVEKINSIVEFMDNQNIECDNLIDNLITKIESVNQQFSQLQSGIRKKYSLQNERLKYLNSQQINDFLNSFIQFTEYKEQIIANISEQIQNLNNSFYNFYQQLQLSSINYYQINDQNSTTKDCCNQGYQLYLDGKYDQAIEILDKSIQQDPKDHLSLWCKGDQLKRLNQFEEAITFLDKALAIDPKHVDSLCWKGDCLRGLNKHEDAITWLDKALAIDSKHVYSLCWKGECLRQMKKYNESIKLLDQALSIDPQHISSLKSKGFCLEYQLKYKEALIYYELVLKLNPNDQWTKIKIDFCKNQLKP